MPDRNIKKKQFGWLALKVGILGLSAALLYLQISKEELASAFRLIHFEDVGSTILLLSAILVLLAVNLSLETYKWHLLVAPFGVSFFTAFRHVLSGIAGGVVSPNRIGDPIVRSFLLPSKFRVRGLLPATFCSFSQLLATAIFGSIALINISWKTLNGISKLFFTQLTMAFLVIVLIWVAMRFFEKRIGRIRLSKALIVVAASLLRYFTFCLQLWLIFLLFSREVQFEPMFFAIALTFLANAIIPSFAFTELGIRAAGAALFFPMFGIDATIAALATLLLWAVNMALPAIPGMVMLTTYGISLTELKGYREAALRREIPEEDNDQ